MLSATLSSDTSYVAVDELVLTDDRCYLATGLSAYIRELLSLTHSVHIGRFLSANYLGVGFSLRSLVLIITSGSFVIP